MMNDPHHPFRSEDAKRAYLSWYDERAERWPVESEQRLVETSFGKTFVRVSGPEDGQPLVLLPGDSENSLSWIPQIAAFSAQYRIFDNGRSVYSRSIENPGDFVAWLDELLGELRLESVNLVAHSYGGWISSIYALAHQDRLRKLVLIAPSGTVLRPPIGLIVRALLYYFLPFHFITRRYLYWYAPDSVREEKSRKVIDEMIEEEVLAKRCFKRRKFVAPTVLTDDEWGRLTVPTLYLVGENEVTYSSEKAINRLAEVAPQVQTAVAAGADHHLAMAKPEWVNGKILDFLRD